jgi:hypothetical protein
MAIWTRWPSNKQQRASRSKWAHTRPVPLSAFTIRKTTNRALSTVRCLHIHMKRFPGLVRSEFSHA